MIARHRFEALVRPLLPDLYRFARRLTGDPVRAEDLLQQSLERGLTRLHQLEHEGAFKVWQTRVIYSVWHNQRARRTAMTVEPSELERRVLPLDDRAGPDGRLATRRLSDRLATALDLLPDAQRAAVWLVDGQGHTFAETAEILGIAPGTVASRVARGRVALRVTLRDVAAERGVGR